MAIFEVFCFKFLFSTMSENEKSDRYMYKLGRYLSLHNLRLLSSESNLKLICKYLQLYHKNMRNQPYMNFGLLFILLCLCMKYSLLRNLVPIQYII